MIELEIPGFGHCHLEHLVMDYNGTLALDGQLMPGVHERAQVLAEKLRIHVLTADTFGHARSQLSSLPASVFILPEGNQDTAKCDYVETLGASLCVCIGNGRNDSLMLKAARIGIALLQDEGASTVTITQADILCRDILTALDLLTNPKRLTATLRT